MKPGTDAHGGKAGHAWPISTSPGVLCALNYADQGQKKCRKAQNPAVLAPHLCVLIHPW